jgi:hypothetical protein
MDKPAGSQKYLDVKSDPKVIMAEGEVKLREKVFYFVGVLVVLLLLVTFVYPLVNKDASYKDLWAITGPLISGSVVALVGVVAGKNKN